MLGKAEIAAIVPVSDVEKAVEFYGGTLGLELQIRRDDLPENREAEFRACHRRTRRWPPAQLGDAIDPQHDPGRCSLRRLLLLDRIGDDLRYVAGLKNATVQTAALTELDPRHLKHRRLFFRGRAQRQQHAAYRP